MTSTQCANLTSRSSFGSYIGSLNSFTSDNLTVASLEPCRLQICTSLWGTGNPDISGIGVITANFLELCLGTLLAIGVTLLKKSKNGRSFMVQESYRVFADSALIYSFSVQLASLIILARKDFGLSADGLGGLTVEVTWTASLLTMLPIVLLCFVPARLDGAKLERPTLRLGIVCVSLIFFIYIFFSRMIGNFGPSEISNSPGAVITPSNWTVIEQLCFVATPTLSGPETIAFDVFTISGSLFVCTLVIGALVYAITLRQGQDLEERWRGSKVLGYTRSTPVQILLIFGVFAFGVPQIWAMLRFRAMQSKLATSIGSVDYDNGWSFGQIIAVVIFLPVGLEFVYRYVDDESDTKSEEHTPEAQDENVSEAGMNE